MTTNNKKSQAGRLRIVAGIWRSRLLKIADVPGLRPSSARVRETLFNWLAPRLPGARCLDLFAGTGALGLEALSRGAVSVVFIEKSARAVRTLQENIASLATDGAVVRQDDARRYVSSAPAAAYDIVFLDPPYAADMLDEMCRLLHDHGVLATDASVYFELDKRQTAPALPPGWSVQKKNSAGNVRYFLVTANRMESD